MKLTNEILAVLKSFASINNGIRVKKGDVIDTISHAENIIASAKIETGFPETFFIYDLNEFLSTISLFKNPEMVFESDKYAKITEEGSRSSVKYYFADESTIKTFDGAIDMPSVDVSFTLNAANLNSIQRAASVLQSPEILVTGHDGVLEMIALDSGDDTANSYSIILGDYDGKDCKFYFKTENLKLIPNDYEVQISSDLISNFNSDGGDLNYFIAVEENSSIA